MALAGWALDRSFYRFPWNFDSILPKRFGRNSRAAESVFQWPSQSVGWPNAALASQMKGDKLLKGEALLISLWVGLFWFVSLINANRSDLEAIEMFITIIIVVGLILRLGIYSSECSSPISFVGRLMTGRSFVPSYAILFVSPLLVVGVYLVLVRWNLWGLIPTPMSQGLGCALAIWILLKGPPHLNWWKYCSKSSLPPPALSGTNKVNGLERL